MDNAPLTLEIKKVIGHFAKVVNCRFSLLFPQVGLPKEVLDYNPRICVFVDRLPGGPPPFWDLPKEVLT